MALNRLVWHCWIPGTSASENGIGVRLQRLDGERILFFRTDTADARHAFGLGANSRMCDAVVFYRDGGDPAIFIFAEFKGADIAHAVSQIEVTAAAIKGHLPQLPRKRRFVAIVISSGSAPPAQKQLQKRLENHGISVAFKCGVKKQTIDIRQYLDMAGN